MPQANKYVDPDKAILAQLKEGSERAFHQIYSLYSERIYGRLIKLLKDEDVADSVLQDVFLRIWERRDKIDPEQPFKAYLYKIAENFVYDHFRKVARDLRLQVRLRQMTSELYVHIEEDIFKKENERLIQHALEKLQTQRRKIFQLCKIDGKSYHEASELLGISESTISNQLVKATKSIRDYVSIESSLALTVLAVVFPIR